MPCTIIHLTLSKFSIYIFTTMIRIVKDKMWTKITYFIVILEMVVKCGKQLTTHDSQLRVITFNYFHWNICLCAYCVCLVVVVRCCDSNKLFRFLYHCVYILHCISLILIWCCGRNERRDSYSSVSYVHKMFSCGLK